MNQFPSPPKTIDGQRIRLIARETAHADALFKLIDQNRQHLGRWMAWEKTTQSVQDSIAYLELAQGWWSKGATFDYSIFDKVSGEMLGSFGIHSIRWENKSCELGYWIDHRQQGKGYISEAVVLGEQLAFELGFHRVVITCDRHNERSRRVAERLGWRLETVQIDERPDISGSFRDTLQFVKLLNPLMEGRITENLPAGYSIKQLDSETFWDCTRKKMDEVFSDGLIFLPVDLYTTTEREKLKELNTHFKYPFTYHAVVYCKDKVVGWTWGFQDSRDGFYMVNSGVLPEHRGRGLYSRLLQLTLQELTQKGFQRVWSRHTATNNQVIIAKLKQGFHITGSELSDIFGSLVHLTYFTNPTRKKVLNFRAGQIRPDEEVKKALDL